MPYIHRNALRKDRNAPRKDRNAPLFSSNLPRKKITINESDIKTLNFADLPKVVPVTAWLCTAFYFSKKINSDAFVIFIIKFKYIHIIMNQTIQTFH